MVSSPGCGQLIIKGTRVTIEAIERVRKFLDESRKMRGIETDEIAVVQTGSDKEATLTVADLEVLLTAALRPIIK